MNKWQKVTDTETREIFKNNCKWEQNKYMPTAYDAKIQFKSGKQAQLQWDKITNELFILEL